MRFPIVIAPAFLASFSLLAQPLGSEFRVNTFTSSYQRYPHAAGDSNGNFVVVWESFLFDGSGIGVSCQRYASDGSPQGTEFRTNSFTVGTQQFPNVGMNAGGSFVVVWVGGGGQDGDQYGIFGQRYASDGSASGGEFRVNATTSGSQRRPSVALDAAGDFVAVWMGPDPNNFDDIFGRRFSSAGTPLGAEFRANTYTTLYQRHPAVATDSSGNFVVVWDSMGDGDNYGIVGQRYGSDGSPSGAQFLVNAYPSSAQVTPSVATQPSGDFVVVWSSFTQDGSFYGAFGQRFSSAGAPLGAEFRANSTTTNTQFSAAVAADSSGNFVVVWSSKNQDGASYGVFGQRYSAAGSPVGGEFRANSFTTGLQEYPTVSAGRTGGFVVAWESPNQDGASYGIFAQRFCVPVSSVTISFMGNNSVCPTATGGTAMVQDTGGSGSHQWGFRTTCGTGGITSITGATMLSYVFYGADFPGVGTYCLVCTTTSPCGASTVSNEFTVYVTADAMAPVVTAPPAATTTQTLCQ